MWEVQEVKTGGEGDSLALPARPGSPTGGRHSAVLTAPPMPASLSGRARAGTRRPKDGRPRRKGRRRPEGEQAERRAGTGVKRSGRGYWAGSGLLPICLSFLVAPPAPGASSMPVGAFPLPDGADGLASEPQPVAVTVSATRNAVTASRPHVRAMVVPS